MILLLGGTSETAPMAEALAHAGYCVLVSTATEIPVAVGNHARISHRCGPLSESTMAEVVQDNRIRAIVDVTHPYADQVRTIAPRVSKQLGIEYWTYVRPGIEMPEGVQSVSTHKEAAEIASGSGKPVLLTIGSKNLEPYAQEALRAGMILIARVLPEPDSIEACYRAGISEERIVTARGPFSVEDTRQVIRRFSIGVLVTKDSGVAGGLMEKLEAARLESCSVIAVKRPMAYPLQAFSDINSLVQELLRHMEPAGERMSCNDE
jgi:precorrin-6A/cobalt-precorrin-6A reductase